MNDLKFIFAFGWPYLRRYKRRFIIGIALGITFGLFQASFLWLTQTLTERIAPESAHKQTVSAVEKVSPFEQFPLAKKFQSECKALIRDLNNFTIRTLDPWLPIKDRSLDWKQILGGLMIIPLLMAVRGMISFGSSYELRWVNEKVMNDLRCDVLKKLNSLSMDYFNRSTVGDMTTRINSDTALLHQALYLGISDLIKEPFTVIAVVGFLIGMNAKLALIALVFLPLCIIPIVVLGKKVRKASAKTVTHYVAASSMLIEALNNIRAVKAFGVESKQEEEFARHNDAFVKHSIRRTRAAELVNPFVEVISSLGIGLIVIYIVYAHLNITDLATLIAGIVLLASPVKKIANLNMLFQRARIGVERLRDIFAEKPSVTDKPDAVALPPFNYEIRLENISFSYKERTILHDVSLVIPKGKKIGIAGESGSGKSTLINLIYRFYDVKSGAIRIDGHDLRDVSSISFRSQMALVSQEVLLFNRSVADNIRIGKSDATLDEIIEAAKAASAHDFIMQMSQGYDTIIGEHGLQLSGGQRQRLSIARAFVRKAPILLLDEATASLDSKAESEIQDTIDRLAEDKTVISIAHRLSTLSNCDEIIVIKEGRIVEQGSFQQLLSSHGHFREMARKQGIIDSY